MIKNKKRKNQRRRQNEENKIFCLIKFQRKFKMIKPITSEKAVRLMEAENTLIFQTDRKMKKPELKKEIEEMFNVKVEKVRVVIRGNKKNCYVRLNKKNPAIDVATKLGMI